MNYSEMDAALKDAEQTMDAADHAASRIARLLMGRLRKVSNTSALRHFKKELERFDSRTGQWKP